MEKNRKIEIRNLVIVISFALFGGFSFYYWGAPSQQINERIQLNKESSDEDETQEQQMRPAQKAAIAESYMRAYQSGNCAEITRTTWWMQERVTLLQNQSLPQDELAQAMEELCDGARRNRQGQHLLSVEGVPDQYVFVPQAATTILGSDSGVKGLSKRVSERVWVRIDYPDQAIALKDAQARPIKSLIVGINISEDGYVVKSGIRGNIDINLDRISYFE